MAAALLAAAALVLPPRPGAAQANLPALGDTASEEFNLGAERKLGDRIMREIRQDPAYFDDPVLLEHLQSVWQPLVDTARRQGHLGTDEAQQLRLEVFLVRDRSVNAFALPGGYVGVHLGLIGMTGTRDELASVLAHELIHITQRHIARGFANSKRQSLIGMASMIVGILAASRSGTSPDAANALITGGQAVAVQGQLNFSRDMEREADRIGLGVLSGAGYSPAGMAAMFEKLALSSRLNDSGGFPYLRSHPLNSERIGEARARLGAAPAASAAASALAPVHAIAQARARVLGDTRPEVLRRWQALEAEGTTGPAAEKLTVVYQGALASVLLRDWPRVDAALDKARALVGTSAAAAAATAGRAAAVSTRSALPAAGAAASAVRLLDLLAAESWMARGDTGRAMAALAPHAADGSRPVLLLQAQLALAGAAAPAGSRATSTDAGLGKDAAASEGSAPGRGFAPPAATAGPLALQRSASALQTWTANHPGDAAAWSALAQTWAALGQRLRAVRAEAEARYALGDLIGAVDRLRAGQALGRGASAGSDFIEASVIDARLRDIEVERRELLAEERRGG